jgi:PAS domain S-box-containing protein
MSNNTKNDEKNIVKNGEAKAKKEYAKLYPTGKSLKKPIKKLWVHQVELEIQNEELRKTQIELELTKQKYTALFNFAPIGYFIVDEKGYITEVNVIGSDMVGIEKNTLINKTFRSCIKNNSYDIFHLNFRKALEEKKMKRCELKMMNLKNEKEFDAELILDPIFNETEKSKGCRAAVIDITDRKDMEKELSQNREELEKRVKDKTSDLLKLINILSKEIEQRKQAEIELNKRSKELEESEKKYRTLIQVSPEAICVSVDEKIVFVNNTAVNILKVKNEDELKGKLFWQFIHPNSTEIIKARLDKFHQGTKDAEAIEITLIRPDGTFVEVGGKAAIIDYEKKKGVLILFQDISLRKKQEASLRRAKSRLVEAQRLAHLGNWDWDIVNNTIWLSDESYKIYGIEPGKFDGTYESLCNMVHPEDRQRVKDATYDAIKNCKSFDSEYRILLPTGEQRYIHKRALIECVNCKAIRMIGTIQCVTEQKKIQNQILLSRQKLRTLAAKMEMIEEQERRKIASDLHDSVGQILAFATRELKYMRKNLPQKTGDALLEIAEQLDKAVTQTRTLSFDLSPSILYDIGFEIAVEDMLEKYEKQRKIKCSFSDDEKPKPLTIPLKVLLYRSIRELLMNTAKHAEAQNVKVSLAKDGSNISVSVEDDGKGFDAVELESSEKSKGFGLFSIRERIEHLGGGFKIDSAKGKGTRTVLTVPLSTEAIR